MTKRLTESQFIGILKEAEAGRGSYAPDSRLQSVGAVRRHVWADQHGIYIDFIKPGRPYQNGYIERFNRTYREDVLDIYLFNKIDKVRQETVRMSPGSSRLTRRA